MLALNVVSCFLLCGTWAITLRDGRYEDVYIVIQDSIQEDLKILDRIQDVFTNASQLLFTATKYQAYFGKIKVVIPRSWSSQSRYKLLPALSTLKTYINIDEGRIKTPHVRSRTNTCGEEGWYMYLTPSFLLETDVTEWGKHENVIVHEWGHLRWGLFDEYPDRIARQPAFYQHAGEWKPVRCSDRLQGTVGRGPICSKRLAETYCNTKQTEKKMRKTCFFCPHEEQSVNTSLMAYQYIHQLTTFCDKDDDSVTEDQRHNSIAPNAQNLLCNSRSAWEVMREHEDFRGNTSPLPSTWDTVPEFEFVQETESFRIFVLDISGSMTTNDRIGTLYQAGEYIIQEKIPFGSWLGIVTFNTQAYTVKSLTQVNTNEDRDALRDALPTNTDGYTCIGCGIEEAILVLAEKLDSPENGEIIVISDGENNRGSLSLSREKAIDAKVVIHTIAVSQQADTTLSDIASETGGKHFTYLETGNISFAAVFEETVSNGLTSAASQSATLVSEKIESANSTKLSFQFAIEQGLGKNTTVTVLTKGHGSIELELYGPNNYRQNITVDEDTATLKIPDIAQVGDYELTITITYIGQTVELFVTSSPTVTDNSVIRVVSRISQSEIDFQTEDLPVVFADVIKSYAPVLNATVNAVVDSSDTTCSLALSDNGIDPDKKKNDGTYSGYIWPWCLRSGRVSIKVHTRGTRGEAMLSISKSGSASPNTDEEETETIGDSFQRTVVTEELYISNYDNDTSGTSDVIAPGRITDLEINNIETATTQYGENRNFTITWTATGDDKNSGKATSYEMKISNISFYLRDSFESAEALNMTNVTLSPQAVGSTEALKIVVDAEESFTETMYFAVRAVDEAGNVGPVSNIVPIVIARGFRASGEQGYAVTDTDDDIVIEDISPSKTSDEYDVKSIIVGVSVAGAVLLIAAGAFLYVKKSMATKAAVTDSQLSICTNNHSMADVEPFNPDQNEKTSTNSSPVLQTIEFPSPFTPSQIKELNTQDFTRPQTPDSDHRYIDTKLETKGTGETVVDIEDETSEFGDPDDYITETTTFTFPVCKVPFHMTNKAFPLKTSAEQEGVKKDHTVDDMSDQNVSERNHSTLPALPFATHENMDRSHPPPNMALHIFKPDAYGPGKKPYSFPAPFSGVSSTLDMSATMIADLETTDDILDNKDIQTADNEIVSGTTDREMHKYRIDINESKNEYLSCYNDNGMPDSVETGSSVTEHSACNDVHTDVCSRDDEVNCESKKSSESEIDETSFYNKEYTKKIEGSLYAGNFEVGSNNASYTEENEVIFRNEAYSVEDVISSRNANTENMEVKAEIECNGRKVGIDSDNES